MKRCRDKMIFAVVTAMAFLPATEGNDVGPRMHEACGAVADGIADLRGVWCAAVSALPEGAARLDLTLEEFVAGMREAAQLYVSGRAMKPINPVFPKLDDPEFGPWFSYCRI